MPTGALRLLALDGGGVRGLSSLMILRRLMATVDPEGSPKPCDYFDMISGTSTGGLIAIMLGRLCMTVDECIDAYTSLSDKVFEKRSHRVSITGKLQGRFDATELEQAVNFVCAMSKETGDTVCLTSYRSPRCDNSDLLSSTKIWQACRATCAAATFFDSIAIGPFGEEFVDGALGANNPVYALWNQAQDVWGDQLWGSLQCIVSIGTGISTLTPVNDDVRGIWATLKQLATETEKTAEQFRRDKSELDDQGRYYRFNVDHGLEEIGLEESSKKKEIAAATRRYIETQAVFRQIQAPFHDLIPLLIYVKLWAVPNDATFSSAFWLDGRSENDLRQSFARYASKIPNSQIRDSRRNVVPTSNEEIDAAVADVLDWLARPDNTDWLLIFDNVDQDADQGGETGIYNIQRYLPDDHGSVLITTRLARLAQLGDSRQLRKVDKELSMSIFERWYGQELVMDETGQEFVDLLDGLPLALAQAASYLRETKLDAATYVRFYKQQWADLMKSDGEAQSPLVGYEQRSIGTTWTISFKAIRARSEDAADLLRLWAFMDNKDLWHGLLQAAMDEHDEWPRWLYSLASDEVIFVNAIRLLLRYSMIEAEESVSGSYIMHPVVHRWAAYMQIVAKKENYFRLALVLTVNNLGILYQKQGPLKEAEIMYQRALQGREKVLGPNHTSTLDTVNNLGIFYAHQGRLREAEALYQRALQGKEKALGPENTSTLDTVNNLGILYRTQGRRKEAEEMYRRALQCLEKALGPEHIDTLDTINNLGILYQDQGRSQEAMELIQRALLGREKALGSDHTSTLNTINNLGALYRNQGRLQEAEAMYKRALQGLEKALGPDHTSTRVTVSNLGALYLNQGRLQEAKAMYQRGRSGNQAVLVAHHRKSELLLQNMQSLQLPAGQYHHQSSLLPTNVLIRFAFYD
ncbi:acyl transferase/acyl hydrolase/lysophospholipase [Corynascus similis CBS 632.67]